VVLIASTLIAYMERIQAKDRHALMVLQHDVEHRCTIELLKILEDAQCPDYMLQKVLMWAYNAKLVGFDFNPKATSRKANIRWMYQALRHLQQHLPQVISIVLEYHSKPEEIACFDFAPALLSMLQDENLMAPENLVLNVEDPTSMYIPRDNKIGEAHTANATVSFITNSSPARISYLFLSISILTEPLLTVRGTSKCVLCPLRHLYSPRSSAETVHLGVFSAMFPT
jgi:hypothetical protein